MVIIIKLKFKFIMGFWRMASQLELVGSLLTECYTGIPLLGPMGKKEWSYGSDCQVNCPVYYHHQSSSESANWLCSTSSTVSLPFTLYYPRFYNSIVVRQLIVPVEWKNFGIQRRSLWPIFASDPRSRYSTVSSKGCCPCCHQQFCGMIRRFAKAY